MFYFILSLPLSQKLSFLCNVSFNLKLSYKNIFLSVCLIDFHEYYGFISFNSFSY